MWLDAGRTSPYQLYQFFVRSEDAVVGAYLRYFTFLAPRGDPRARPGHRRAPRATGGPAPLARQVCSLVHGEAEMERAERAAGALFSEELADLDERSLLEVLAEAPSTELPRARLDGPGLPLVDLLAETGMDPSKGRARTTVEQGGAYVNNRRETDVGRALGVDDLVAGRYLVLRKGKRSYHLVTFS